jgi:hypothetical protein
MSTATANKDQRGKDARIGRNTDHSNSTSTPNWKRESTINKIKNTLRKLAG